MKSHSETRMVSIAGNIGIGKSSLTTLLSERFGWKPYYEVVDTNPYLADFYGDMRRWSFHLQVFFLSKRFKHHKEMLEVGGTVIQDRSIYEDVEIFAKNLYLQGKFEERDYRNYQELFSCMTHYLKPPDLLVYLRATVDVLKKRIQIRGRPYELEIPTEYLQQLNNHYDNWVEHYKAGPLLVIDSNNLDYVNSHEDFQHVANLIEKKLSPI